jgi:hypothetical protein
VVEMKKRRIQIEVDEAESLEEAETTENYVIEEAETEENACFYRLKKAKQRHDKLPRPVAGGIPARVPAESEAVQGSLSALGDEQNSLDRSLEAYPPGSLPKVWLCGEVWRLHKEGKSRGGVQRKHPLKENKIVPSVGRREEREDDMLTLSLTFASDGIISYDIGEGCDERRTMTVSLIPDHHSEISHHDPSIIMIINFTLIVELHCCGHWLKTSPCERKLAW